MGIMVSVVLVFLKIGMLFVPEAKYSEKMSQIKGMDEKNQGCDLKGWEYRSITSPSNGFVHRYYHYPSAKPGAPVFLFFHGLNLDGRTFLNLKSLADHYELIAYDLPESTDRYQGKFDDFMAIVSEFIDVMNIRACCLCGVSFGGSIALRLAASHPDIDAQRLVLISTVIVGAGKADKRERRKMARWVAKQPDYKLYWFMEKLFKQSGRNIERDSIQAVQEILRIKHVDFYRQVGVSMGEYDASVDAAKVKCPVLWLMGDKDRLFSDKQTKNIKKYVPQAEFEVIKNGTHSMIYVQGEEISGRIRSFCARHCTVEQSGSRQSPGK